MRVAITLLVALFAVAGPMPALANCSSGGPGGGSSPVTEIPKSIVNPVLSLIGLPPLGGTTSNITNNTTNNTTNITNVTTAEPTGQATPTAVALGPRAGGAGGGAGGGMGGGFAASSGVGGSPVNPSDTPSVQMAGSGASFSGGGGGTTGFADPITMASLNSPMGGNTGNLVMMASADPSTEQPLTPGIPLAAFPAPTGGSDDSMTVAMASPRTAPPATSDGVGFEGQASASTTPGTANTTMLAALIGVGMIGAGWAWRSLGG